MATIIGKEHGEWQSITFTDADTTKDVDLVHTYEKVIIRSDDMGALTEDSTVSFSVDGYPLFNLATGELVALPEDWISNNFYVVLDVAYCRMLTINLSNLTTGDVVFQVRGQNRITKRTDEELVLRTIPT